MGVKPGTTVDIKPVGFNLDTSGKCKLDIPANAPMGEQLVQVKTSRGVSNPIPVLVSDLPENTASPEPSIAAPSTLALPSAMNGRLQKPGDVHRYKFHVT